MKVSQYYHLGRKQPTLDFVDVDISTDVKLFIDPKALLTLNNDWGNYCVSQVQSFFDAVLASIKNGNNEKAISLLNVLREPNETHLGLSVGESQGTALGDQSSVNVWEKLTESQAAATGLIEDLEDTILLIPGISYDRISDITTNIIRDALIIYTQEVCAFYGIPVVQEVDSGPVWDPEANTWKSEYTSLPLPEDKKLLLVPKAIVRKSMHYDEDEYYNHFILEFLREKELNDNSSLVYLLKSGRKRVNKKDVKAKYGSGKEMMAKYSQQYPEILERYRKYKSQKLSAPLTNQEIVDYRPEESPNYSELLESVKNVPLGKQGAVQYEIEIEKYLTAIFYPSLTNPKIQNEIHQGRKRIDITYTNTAVDGFFKWLAVNYNAPYVHIECKNYSTDPTNPEIDQLSGRFSRERGRFGLLICRKIDDKALFRQRCKDTASDGRGFIIGLDDDDLEILVTKVTEEFYTPKYDYLKSLFDELVM